ncbi:MAG TPA: archaetidylserine decarboxylase [Myxococcaceae bacterium]|nr:archaetidylserine decarboxylase [Myxococcaceae bacterium]
MRDQTFMALMRLLPKAALSSAVGQATRVPAPRQLHQLAMRAFARRYRVALDEAELGIDGYSTFAEFFSRRLKPGLRPVDPDPRAVISPVDGAVSQIGYAHGDACVQAKGIDFPLGKLLGGDRESERFRDGAFATLYLAPRDYHRIHAPLGGKIIGYGYMPGEFWPVNPRSVRNKDALFCLNERLVTYLTTFAGICAVVKVGATCVARIRAAYDEVVTHSGQGALTRRYDPAIPVEKGGELGAFEMGSTVILLFEKGRMEWDPALGPESVVRMGQRLGTLA